MMETDLNTQAPSITTFMVDVRGMEAVAPDPDDVPMLIDLGTFSRPQSAEQSA